MLHYLVIRSLVNGDENAFRQVYYHYYNYVYQCALRILKQQDKAEDVVAEIFIWLWERRKEFDTPSELKAYLTVAVKYRCLNIIRYEKRRSNKVARVREALYTEDYIDPDKSFRILTKDKALELIYAFAEELKVNIKVPFFLYYAEGESAVAIAEHLRVTRQTVQYSLVEGRKYVRARIAMLPYKVIREHY
jgi:RNA polymerase sigma factor (sigma-70 family)